MNIHTSFEAKTRANMKAIRARLMGKPVKPAPKKKPAVTWVEPYRRPIVDEDSHVRLWRWYLLNKREIDVILSRQTPLDDFAIAPERESMKQICQRVINALGNVTNLSEIIGDRRARVITEVRGKCYYEVRKLRPDLSFPAMGRFFNRDHTTILYITKKLEKQGWTGI